MGPQFAEPFFSDGRCEDGPAFSVTTSLEFHSEEDAHRAFYERARRAPGSNIFLRREQKKRQQEAQIWREHQSEEHEKKDHFQCFFSSSK